MGGSQDSNVICPQGASPFVAFGWFGREFSKALYCLGLVLALTVLQFSVVRAPPVATLVISCYFIASFLWAPPVATQLSVLS